MNNDWYEWIFSGIGTSIVSGIAGIVIGGFSGYKVGIYKSKIKQTQKAKENAKQSQVGTKVNSSNTKKKIIQTQKAENKAEQIQVGEE